MKGALEMRGFPLVPTIVLLTAVFLSASPAISQPAVGCASYEDGGARPLGTLVSPWEPANIDDIEVIDGAFLAHGAHHLELFSLGAGDVPQWQWRYETDYAIRDLAVSGGGLYLIDWSSNPDRLVVHSFGTISAPESLAAIPLGGDVRCLSSHGRFVYVSGPAIRVFDVSDLTAPVLVDSIVPPPDSGYWVTGANSSTLYAPRTPNGIDVFDLSNPAHPALLGTIPTGSFPEVVCTTEDRLVFRTGTQAQQILNLADISVGPLPDHYSSTVVRMFGRWDQVRVSGSLALLLGDAVGVLDVSKPDAPRFIAHVPTGFGAPGGAILENRAVLGGARWEPVGYELYDLSAPECTATTDVLHVGQQVVDVFGAPGGALCLLGFARLHVATPGTDGHPLLVSELDVPYGAYSGAIRGETAYLTAYYAKKILVVDLSDPEEPSILAELETLGGPRHVTAHGDFLYVCEEGWGLSVIDVSDPENPVPAWRVDLGWPDESRVVGGHLLVAASRLYVLDLSDPGRPVAVGSCIGPVSRVDGAGDYAIGTSPYANLERFDISDPANPVKTEEIPLPGWPEDIFLMDSHVYVAQRSSGLTVCRAEPGAPLEYVGTGRIVDESQPDEPGTGSLFCAGSYGTRIVVGWEEGAALFPPQCTAALSAPASVTARADGLRAFPNPARVGSEVLVRLPEGLSPRWTVHDVSGRLVSASRLLLPGESAPIVSWDGRDGRGGVVGPGVYFLRVGDGDGARTVKIVRVR